MSVVLDFETYYSKEFSLSKITTEEYIRSPQFEIIGVCVKEDDGPIEWITGTNAEIREALLKHDLSTVICHNTAFDGAILSWVLDIHPRLLVDTLSMSRPIIGAKTGGLVGGYLRALSEYFGIGHKGTEIYNTLGKHLTDFSVDDLQRFGEYCKQDVNLTYQLWNKLAPEFPLMETVLINITLKMFTEPAIVLDKPLLVKHLAEVKAHKADLLAKVGGLERDVFMSNDKFAQMLRDRGVEPPTKVSPTTGKEAYAFAKTDPGFQALLSHPNEEVQALAAARLGVKTTIEETRTQAFIDVADRGTLPAFLNYYGASNTGRFCLVGGTQLEVLRKAHNYLPETIALKDLAAGDLVWDGESYVAHGGLLDQGEREVITYQGITGTPDHRVFVEEQDGPCELLEAAEKHYTIKTAGAPSSPRLSANASVPNRRCDVRKAQVSN